MANINSTADLIKVMLFSGTLAVVLLGLGFRYLRLVRKAKDTPRSRIATAAQGECEIHGFAWHDGEHAQNLQGHPVVYHSVRLERYEKRGKHSTWVTKFSWGFSKPFFVVDDSGAAYFTPKGFSIHPESRTRGWNWLSEAEKGQVLAATNGRVSGFPPSGFLGGILGVRWRVAEDYIRVGAPLFVLASLDSSGDFPVQLEYPQLKNFVGRLKRIAASSSARLALLDKNRDGKVSGDELKEGLHFAAVGAMHAGRKVSGDSTSTPSAALKEKVVHVDAEEVLCHGHLVNHGVGELFVGDQDQFVRRKLWLGYLLLAGGAVELWFFITLVMGHAPS